MRFLVTRRYVAIIRDEDGARVYCVDPHNGTWHPDLERAYVFTSKRDAEPRAYLNQGIVLTLQDARAQAQGNSSPTAHPSTSRARARGPRAASRATPS